MPRKPGSKPKDSTLTFNPYKKGTLSGEDERKARMEKSRVEHVLRTQQKEIAKLEGQIANAKEIAGIPDDDLEASADDTKAAYQMLQDMRYGYKNSVGPGGLKGRRRLLKLMESDQEFKFVVKELLRIEAALKKAEAEGAGRRGQEGNVQQNFFVVLKGLETEKGLMDTFSSKPVNGLDMKQISHAMNPSESGVYEVEEESRKAEPEQLFKMVGDDQAKVEDTQEQGIKQAAIGGVDGW